ITVRMPISYNCFHSSAVRLFGASERYSLCQAVTPPSRQAYPPRSLQLNICSNGILLSSLIFASPLCVTSEFYSPQPQSHGSRRVSPCTPTLPYHKEPSCRYQKSPFLINDSCCGRRDKPKKL